MQMTYKYVVGRFDMHWAVEKEGEEEEVNETTHCSSQAKAWIISNSLFDTCCNHMDVYYFTWRRVDGTNKTFQSLTKLYQHRKR